MDRLLGVAGVIITSDEMDHSRKFPAFRTSMSIYLVNPMINHPQFHQWRSLNETWRLTRYKNGYVYVYEYIICMKIIIYTYIYIIIWLYMCVYIYIIFAHLYIYTHVVLYVCVHFLNTHLLLELHTKIYMYIDRYGYLYYIHFISKHNILWIHTLKPLQAELAETKVRSLWELPMDSTVVSQWSDKIAIGTRKILRFNHLTWGYKVRNEGPEVRKRKTTQM